MILPYPRSFRPASKSSGTRRILTFVITEAIESPKQYHWSSIGEQQMGLCGTSTMPTDIEERFWGVQNDQQPLEWCAECASLKQRILPDSKIVKK